jgi:hypothetical protein
MSSKTITMWIDIYIDDTTGEPYPGFRVLHKEYPDIDYRVSRGDNYLQTVPVSFTVDTDWYNEPSR